MIRENADGSISFHVFLPDARRLEILGDFTGWRARPLPMRRDDAGWWHAAARLGHGEYLFSYLVDGDRWLPDYAAHGIRANPYGGWVSQLSVSAGQVARAA